ncbi:uncharacterized protein LOC112046439 isoform X2 [Bicyclus anynana]|uniref:Uncharacterized protein LOC112046439 isoform X2 n=1 Tax=Bicyclus anynana TaxID=110368 RepID=A0A6J1N1A4_BICAN|nr:uncharacterized protein LOC112046439 isoform X2 [Bicyclus anynana]
MSGSAQEGDGAAAETGAAATVQDLYREKPSSTLVRVMTVMAYLFSVSFAAILLSIYYICVWRSPVVAKFTDNREMLLNARRGEAGDYHFTYDDPHNVTGGSDTPVNDTATPPTLDNIVNFTSSNDTALPTLDYLDDSTSVAPQDTTVDGEVDVTTVT